MSYQSILPFWRPDSPCLWLLEMPNTADHVCTLDLWCLYSHLCNLISILAGYCCCLACIHPAHLQQNQLLKRKILYLSTLLWAKKNYKTCCSKLIYIYKLIILANQLQEQIWTQNKNEVPLFIPADPISRGQNRYVYLYGATEINNLGSWSLLHYSGCHLQEDEKFWGWGVVWRSR